MPNTELRAPTALDITVITDDSTRAEIEEALGHCSTSAGRCLSRDHIGNPNPEWAKLHRFLDYLLDLWERKA